MGGAVDIINNAICSTHKLVAILIVNISEVDVLVNEIVAILDDDIEHSEMIKLSIGYLVKDSFQHNVPNNVYSILLINRLLDEYRIGISMDTLTSEFVDSKILTIVGIVHYKMHNIALTEKYIPITSDTSRIPNHSIFAVSNLDLHNFRTIEFKFYDYRGSHE